MEDEKGYRAHIMDINDALQRLHGVDAVVMHKAYELWLQTQRILSDHHAANTSRMDANHLGGQSRRGSSASGG